MAWKQLHFDWDKAGRDDAALRRHCLLCGLQPADAALLVALNRHGETQRDTVNGSPVSRSVLRAPMRRVAELAQISAGAVHKAKRRLTGRRPELLRYFPESSTWVVSWARVWALPLLPTPAEQWQRAEDDAATRPDGPPRSAPPPAAVTTSEAVSAHGRSRPPKKERFINLPDPRNQESHTLAQCLAQSSVLAGDSDEIFNDQVDRFARRIVDRVRPIESRCHVAASDRLEFSTARRIACGVCESPDSDVGQEFERVLGSVGRQSAFKRGPAAYLVGCAKRRGWMTGGRAPGATAAGGGEVLTRTSGEA